MNLKHIQIDRHVLNQLQPSCEHYLGGDWNCVKAVVRRRGSKRSVVALLIAFLCVHCARGSTDFSAFRYFEVVTLWFLIAFLIFYLMYVFRLQSKIPCINWTMTELLHYGVGTILVFIASIVAAVKSGGVSELEAGSAFGFIATFLLAVSIWTSYKVTCGSQPTSASV